MFFYAISGCTDDTTDTAVGTTVVDVATLVR